MCQTAIAYSICIQLSLPTHWFCVSTASAADVLNSTCVPLLPWTCCVCVFQAEPSTLWRSSRSQSPWVTQISELHSREVGINLYELRQGERFTIIFFDPDQLLYVIREIFTCDSDDGTNIQAANSFMTASHSCVMIVIIIVFIRVTVWRGELLPNER